MLGAVALVSVVNCTEADGGPRARAVSGQLDLSTWDPERDGAVALDGEWAFCWGELLPAHSTAAAFPGASFATVPGSWNEDRKEGVPVGGHGVATFGLRVLLPPHADEVELGLKLSGQRSAFTLFVDGRQVSRGGFVGHDKASTLPGRKPEVVALGATGSSVQLILHVANFHYRRGGTRSLILGEAKQLRGARERGLAMDFFLFGGLLMMALYHLCWFALRKHEPAPLYFGTFCLIIATRAAINGEEFLTSWVPELGFEFFLVLEYITVYLGLPLFCMFCREIYPAEFDRRVLRVIKWLGFIFTALVLLTPEWVYGHTFRAYHVIILLSCAYVGFVIWRAHKNGRLGAWVFLLGFCVLFAVTLNDILNQNMILSTGFWTPLGLAGFVLSQAFVLSLRFSRSFDENVRLKHHLEDVVEERTEELRSALLDLEQANQVLEDLSRLDGLTRVNNRRVFDSALDSEWRRAHRDRTPLAMLLIDIDHFKAINDTYGHLCGDECLKAVASCIRANAGRTSDMVARYGGEEFAVLLANTHREGAYLVAERIRIAVSTQPVATSKGIVKLTVSTGVSVQVPDRRNGGLSLVAAADEALYEAKATGRNRTCQTAS